jgi:hypothetical protein
VPLQTGKAYNIYIAGFLDAVKTVIVSRSYRIERFK